MRVGILTPTTHGRADFLELLKDALIKQTIGIDNLIWVIIENGEDTESSNIKSVVDGFIKKNGKVIHHIMLGKHPIGKIRNKSIELILETKPAVDYIVQCDDDDYYYPDRVKYAVKMLSINKADLAGCTVTHLWDANLGGYCLGPYGKYHGLANSLAFTPKYARENKYDPLAWKGEETSFCNEFKNPMIQLDPYKVCIQSIHSNTVEKRRLILDSEFENSKTKQLITPIDKLFGKQKTEYKLYYTLLKNTIKKSDEDKSFSYCNTVIYLGDIELNKQQTEVLCEWINTGYRSNPTMHVIVFLSRKSPLISYYDDINKIWWLDITYFSFNKVYSKIILVGFNGQYPLLAWGNKMQSNEIICDCTFALFNYTPKWVDYILKLLSTRSSSLLIISDNQADSLKKYSKESASLVCLPQTHVCNPEDPVYHKMS
tara:strand:+ start:634 stop:1920 length:1287 start_codon:yes stop_codon:yes gene_type:complete